MMESFVNWFVESLWGSLWLCFGAATAVVLFCIGFGRYELDDEELIIFAKYGRAKVRKVAWPLAVGFYMLVMIEQHATLFELFNALVENWGWAFILIEVTSILGAVLFYYVSVSMFALGASLKKCELVKLRREIREEEKKARRRQELAQWAASVVVGTMTVPATTVSDKFDKNGTTGEADVTYGNVVSMADYKMKRNAR